MSEQTTEPEVRPWGRYVQVFAAMDNMERIAERVLGIVGKDRVMNKIATYIHAEGPLTSLSNLDHATGLHVGGHQGYPEGHHTWTQEDQAGFDVYLTHRFGGLGRMEGFGVNALAWNAATEEQVRERYRKALARQKESSWDGPRDITMVTLQGFPGEPSREDRIEIQDWNQHGVLRHTVITFVEPDYCDSGRVVEHNYVVLGHVKEPDRERFALHKEPAQEFGSYGRNEVGLGIAREHAKRLEAEPDIDMAWVAEEKVIRERRSV